MLTQYQKLRLLTAAGVGAKQGGSDGHEEEEGLPGSRGEGRGGTEERGGKSWGSWQQTGNRDGVKGGARHLAIILGHLAEGIALGVPRA